MTVKKVTTLLLHLSLSFDNLSTDLGYRKKSDLYSDKYSLSFVMSESELNKD